MNDKKKFTTEKKCCLKLFDDFTGLVFWILVLVSMRFLLFETAIRICIRICLHISIIQNMSSNLNRFHKKMMIQIEVYLSVNTNYTKLNVTFQ